MGQGQPETYTLAGLTGTPGPHSPGRRLEKLGWQASQGQEGRVERGGCVLAPQLNLPRNCVHLVFGEIAGKMKRN